MEPNSPPYKGANMQNTKLLLLEGLPGTGKSTNAYFLYRQLPLNGKPARWFHEVARPHPVLFFDEAAPTYGEYEAFIKKYPETAPALRRTAVFRKSTVGIDLMELEWNHRDSVTEETLKALRAYDVWCFPLERYKTIALEKWAHFTEEVLRREEICLLDSAIFQFQIFTFLLKDRPLDEWKGFVSQLMEILRPLDPGLIYFYREDTEEAIRFLEEQRGVQFLEDIWNRDKHEPYYQNRSRGAEGQRQFLRDYARTAKALFELMDCPKQGIKITGQDWEHCENQLLDFTGIKHRPYPDIQPPEGSFRESKTGFSLRIQGRELTDPRGDSRILTPKSEREFYVENLPTLLRFDGLDRITVADGQIAERWTAVGSLFERIPEDASAE